MYPQASLLLNWLNIDYDKKIVPSEFYHFLTFYNLKTY